MKLDLPTKVAAFCRELGDTALLDMARQEKMEPVYRRAEESLKKGGNGQELEADLDALDAMVAKVAGQGLYPPDTRMSYPGLPPGAGLGAGARWWTCPRGLCSGQGRVRPGESPPSCHATGVRLVPGPMPE